MKADNLFRSPHPLPAATLHAAAQREDTAPAAQTATPTIPLRSHELHRLAQRSGDPTLALRSIGAAWPAVPAGPMGRGRTAIVQQAHDHIERLDDGILGALLAQRQGEFDRAVAVRDEFHCTNPQAFQSLELAMEEGVAQDRTHIDPLHEPDIVKAHALHLAVCEAAIARDRTEALVIRHDIRALQNTLAMGVGELQRREAALNATSALFFRTAGHGGLLAEARRREEAGVPRNHGDQPDQLRLLARNYLAQLADARQLRANLERHMDTMKNLGLAPAELPPFDGATRLM